MIDNIQNLLLLALFVESAVQWAKKEYRNPFTYLALTVGLIVAYATQINYLVLIGLNDISWRGIVGIGMFGSVLARGSNLANDLFNGKFTGKTTKNLTLPLNQDEP